MKFPPLKDARSLPNFRLWVRFADDTETVVDFSEQLSTPVMRPIATPEMFAQVRVAESGSYLYWEAGTPIAERPDASSDWLYLQSFPEDARRGFEADLAASGDWQKAADNLRAEFRRGSEENVKALSGNAKRKF